MKKKLRCCAITKKGSVCKKRKGNDIYCNQHTKECTICLEQCKTPKTLNCSHTYCNECISKWIYLEINTTCPNCRTDVTYEEENEMFRYCYENNFLSKVVINEYIIDDEELIEFTTNILQENSNYSADEWVLFKRYLILNTDLEEKFNNVRNYVYTYYKKFNPNEEHVIEDGKSIIYLYKINIE